MAAKRRILPDSEDDETEDTTKKARTGPDKQQDVDGSGVRRSERSGKGSGGRLTQMKNLERMQTERTKLPSAVDIATQGEEVNPMAPSSQDTRSTFRKGRAPSNGAEFTPSQFHTQPPPPLRPEFTLAAPGQQFGFRLPGSVSQTEKVTQAQAPARTRFLGVSSSFSNHDGSQPPTRARFSPSQSSSRGSAPPSRGASLFSGGSLAATSTAPTSRAPSKCSSGERRLVQQRELVSRNLSRPHSLTSTLANVRPAAISSRPATDDRERDTAPVRSKRIASFYDPPVEVNRTSHSLSAAPDFHDPGDIQSDREIDEVSPSEDDRMAETVIHRRDNADNADDEHLERSTTPSGGEDYGRFSPPLDNVARTPLSPMGGIDDGTTFNNSTVRRRQSQPIPHTSGHAPVRNGVVTQREQTPRLPLQSEDIVTVHRQRNRAPRLPNNNELLAARQQQQASSTNRVLGEPSLNDEDQEPPAASQTGQGSTTAPKSGRPPRSTSERAEPWQLQFYDPPTRDIIERAKQFSHCDAASINAYPVRATFNAKAIEYIDEAIAERVSRGLIVSDGWWPQYTSGITRLLWEDLGSWRSAMRKKARTFVTQRYEWDAENRRDRNIEIAKNLLGNGGLFLKDGTDEEGHTNNLAHPALSGLIVDFFYTGPASVGKLFPEVFAQEVPRVTVAIAGTALKVVLDELASGQGEVNFRVNIYMPVYTEILGLMSKCDTNMIHCAKTRDLRRRWAQLGSNGMTNQEQSFGGCGFNVDLD